MQILYNSEKQKNRKKKPRKPVASGEGSSNIRWQIYGLRRPRPCRSLDTGPRRYPWEIPDRRERPDIESSRSIRCASASPQTRWTWLHRGLVETIKTYSTITAINAWVFYNSFYSAGNSFSSRQTNDQLSSIRLNSTWQISTVEIMSRDEHLMNWNRLNGITHLHSNLSWKPLRFRPMALTELPVSLRLPSSLVFLFLRIKPRIISPFYCIQRTVFKPW